MITKGFTLIELIIVIGIIALLATTVILVINPVKIFQEARDSQRLADLGQVNSAMGLYVATSGTISLDNDAGNLCDTVGAVAGKCWVHNSTPAAGANCSSRYAGKTTVASAIQKVDGTGWLPVNLGTTSGGAPLAAYPRDPKKDRFYAYACTEANNTFELSADMESGRYSNGGDDDVENTDGGTNADLFEVGTNVQL